MAIHPVWIATIIIIVKRFCYIKQISGQDFEVLL